MHILVLKYIHDEHKGHKFKMKELEMSWRIRSLKVPSFVISMIHDKDFKPLSSLTLFCTCSILQKQVQWQLHKDINTMTVTLK
jgi:hypothetical protein